MTKAEWFALYAQSHQNPLNRKIHKICVPAIVYAQTGILFLIPDPSFWPPGGPGFFAVVELILALAFYLSWKDFKLAAVLTALYVVPNLILWTLVRNQAPQLLALLSVGIFIVAWIGQFYGHKVEGRKPSFFQDLQFLLIGPAWVLSH